MYEKYNAYEVGHGGGGGEYVPQMGFGWSNAVALLLLEDKYPMLSASALPTTMDTSTDTITISPSVPKNAPSTATPATTTAAGVLAVVGSLSASLQSSEALDSSHSKEEVDLQYWHNSLLYTAALVVLVVLIIIVMCWFICFIRYVSHKRWEQKEIEEERERERSRKESLMEWWEDEVGSDGGNGYSTTSSRAGDDGDDTLNWLNDNDTANFHDQSLFTQSAPRSGGKGKRKKSKKSSNSGWRQFVEYIQNMTTRNVPLGEDHGRYAPPSDDHHVLIADNSWLDDADRNTPSSSTGDNNSSSPTGRPTSFRFAPTSGNNRGNTSMIRPVSFNDGCSDDSHVVTL